MDLQGYLDSKNITKYRLSKIRGVPKTTIIDICYGKSYTVCRNVRTTLNAVCLPIFNLPWKI